MEKKLEQKIFLQLQLEQMLEYSNQNYSSLSNPAESKLKTITYRQKQTTFSSDRPNFPLCPPMSKLKNKFSIQDKQNDSIDTCQSDHSINASEAKQPRINKLKVQLCKNFMEKGYCPYENRCRFAHGVEQLRAKDTHCSSDLYRTRKCKIFFEKHQCKFGKRCNFMHENRNLNEIVTTTSQSVRSALRCQFLEVKISCADNKLSSRLLSILQIEQKLS